MMARSVTPLSQALRLAGAACVRYTPQFKMWLEADDCQQIARIEGWRAHEDFDPSRGRRLSTLVYAYVYRGLIRAARKTARASTCISYKEWDDVWAGKATLPDRARAPMSLEREMPDGHIETHPEARATDDVEREVVLKAYVETLLAGLTPMDRAVVRAYYFDGLDTRQVGAMFGRSHEWARLRLDRARRRMREGR